MIRPDVIYLIAENAATHGVHDTVEDVKRKVLCTVESVTRSEFYNALNVGIRPERVFRIPIGDAYHEERLVEFHGKRYRVIRTYEAEDGSLELTVERGDVNGEETDTDSSDTDNSNS